MYIIFLYHFYAFLYGLQPLAMATATDCFVLDIIISDYHVIHICNLEQFENKVTNLLTYAAALKFVGLYITSLFAVRYYKLIC